VRARYRLPERYFLYLGSFEVRKNVRNILLAYRRYLDRGGDPAVALVIAGQLPARHTAFAPDPQKIAAELNLQDQVRFCGWVAEKDKPALYVLATAYLFPSLYEGFGMMLLEAMQAGAPVITSGHGT
jgi:glycosyltransferase involved in cell wall biosynthesis